MGVMAKSNDIRYLDVGMVLALWSSMTARLPGNLKHRESIMKLSSSTWIETIISTTLVTLVTFSFIVGTILLLAIAKWGF